MPRLPLVDANSDNPLEASIARLRHEELALEAETHIQPAKTQDEREYWQRLADYHWNLA